MCHSPGSHAELAVSDYGRAMKIPDGMSYEQAATLPIGLNTLHNALITAGRMKAGESVMVQGASSGVGIIGLQIAKLMGAKLVVGTSTNDGAPRAAEGVRRRPRGRHQGCRAGPSRC